MVSPFAQHLGTDYVLSDDEVPAIRDVISKGEEALVAIDQRTREAERQVKELQRELRALAKRRVEKRKEVDEHKSLISRRCPIRRVNDDILISIYIALLDIVQDHSLCISSDHPAVVISHVCQRWRQTALSTKLFWCDLRVEMPVYPTSTCSLETWGAEVATVNEMAEAWISRSGDHQISFNFDQSRIPPSEVIGAVAECAEFQRLVNTLCSSSSRWKHLVLQFWQGEPHNFPTDRLLSVSPQSPVLTSVEVFCRYFREDFQPLLSERLVSSTNILNAPTLRSLKIRGQVLSHDIMCMPVVWAKLEHLYFDGYPSESSHHFDAVGALSLFKECPNLVTCHLDFQRDATVPSDCAPIFLPQFKELSFRYHSFHIPKGFARSLVLPSLRKLQVYDHTACMPYDHHNSGLYEFLERFGATLQDVTFNFRVFTQTAFHYSLQHLTNITSLSLCSGPKTSSEMVGRPAKIDRDIFMYLTPQFNEAGTMLTQLPLCPSLKVLKLSVAPDMIPEAALIKFIEARRRTRDNLALEGGGKVARLRQVDCIYYLFRADINRELRRRGVDMKGFSLRLLPRRC